MELLTVKETAGRYNISASKIRALCQKPDFPAIKIGVGWRIDAEKFEGYINTLMNEKSCSRVAKSTPTKAYIKPARAKVSFLEQLKGLKKVTAV